ncbi:methyltransferase domain-containing protein [Corynebacterium sp. 3HC-13]|uniref:class I SAM-dependent methyltransferase n=1 Tax=Corynebacterium poyangense TaxID=2684405 RepID=UPI001CCF13F4|nr:class I SAM-dependent methyltransferase [Corynebacterium poyangense]MBZ8176771.1 methyltransferase domain-containing protein [Corynebacterium poyangense]
MSDLFHNGQSYAQFRPSYPAEVARRVAELSPGSSLAVDVGCGTGQFSTLIAPYFDRTVGCDPSSAQLQGRALAPGLDYLCADAGELPFRDHCVDLLSVAQAIHWVPLAKFNREACRVLKPGGILIVLSYATCYLVDKHLNALFQDFYWGPFHRFWEPERKIAESNLSGIDLPGKDIPQGETTLRKTMTYRDFRGYLETWSALKTAEQSGPEGRQEFEDFMTQLHRVWQPDQREIEVWWPLTIKITRMVDSDHQQDSH